MGRRRNKLETRQAQMRDRWRSTRPSGPGRPARHLNPIHAFILAFYGVTQAEIARTFGCDRKTLVRHCGASLKHAARARAVLLPRALWQRGPNTIQNAVAAAQKNFFRLESLREGGMGPCEFEQKILT